MKNNLLVLKFIFLFVILMIIVLITTKPAFAAIFGEDLSTFSRELYKWAIGIGGSLATLVLIYAGYLYATSAGNPEQVSQAKEYVIGALAGLAFLLLAAIIYNMLKVQSSGNTGWPGATGGATGGTTPTQKVEGEAGSELPGT